MKMFRIYLLILAFSFGMAGCGSMVINNPSEKEKYIMTPYDLTVSHEGGCRVDDNTFEAWLDPGTPGRQQITNAFSYSNGVFRASNFELPLGSHTLSVTADYKRTWSFCFSWEGGDSRQFLVSEPTCIQGTVSYTYQGGTPTPYPHVPITAMFGREKLAETITDEAGNYCIEVPLSVGKVRLSIYHEDAPPGEATGQCSGAEDDINLGTVSNRCGGDCISVNISTYCTPD